MKILFTFLTEKNCLLNFHHQIIYPKIMYENILKKYMKKFYVCSCLQQWLDMNISIFTLFSWRYLIIFCFIIFQARTLVLNSVVSWLLWLGKLAIVVGIGILSYFFFARLIPIPELDGQIPNLTNGWLPTVLIVIGAYYIATSFFR